MGYKIEPIPIINFLDDYKLRLPRFQRKSTWDKKQNFELAISIFQDYPVGVVIVNNEKNTDWLLDGRQRRNALTVMRKNPVELYEWARSYIGFNKTEDTDQLRIKYWNKVEKYLSTDISPENNDENSEDYDVISYEGDDTIDSENPSFDRERQEKGLKILLDLILMVHQNSPRGSRWERLFDYRDFFKPLKYIDKSKNKVSPELLRKTLLDYTKEVDEQINEDSFVNYYMETFSCVDEDKFKTEVKKNWKDISESINTISEAEKIFANARIGVISLTNASPLDALNIFSRINSGGTQLKAEELLSAKPYWNVKVQLTDNRVIRIINELYDKLGVENGNEVVRWDIPATLISRINDKGLLFDKDDSSEELSIEQITLGFKLISSMKDKGMSAKSVIELESLNEIDWINDINELIDDIDKICDILYNINMFRTLATWKKPLTKLLGNAIALEFITILRKDWERLEKPITSGNSLRIFQQDATLLFDKLVFEYSTKVWRGSGDSKMANDIKEWRDRIDRNKRISPEAWISFINGACDGVYNGQNTTVKLLRPILYYGYSISGQTPVSDVDTSFDVDHIIPQEILNNNSFVNAAFKDSLSNLALLPKKDNISKKNKRLNEITDPWLRRQIVDYTGIRQEYFELYSDVKNWDKLVEFRKQMFVELFGNKREGMIANMK